jgi:hypothetical protein
MRDHRLEDTEVAEASGHQVVLSVDLISEETLVYQLRVMGIQEVITQLVRQQTQSLKLILSSSKEESNGVTH